MSAAPRSLRKDLEEVVNGMTGQLGAIICVVLVWSLGEARSAEQNLLFEMTSVESEGLQGRLDVEGIFETILDRPQTMTVDLIRVNGDLVSSLTSRVLRDGEHMTLDIDETPVVVISPSGQRMELDKFYIEKTATQMYYLHGSNASSWTSDISLSVHDGRLFGNLFFGHEQYFLRFLEGELHVLIRLDGSKFPDEATPLTP